MIRGRFAARQGGPGALERRRAGSGRGRNGRRPRCGEPDASVRRFGEKRGAKLFCIVFLLPKPGGKERSAAGFLRSSLPRAGCKKTINPKCCPRKIEKWAREGQAAARHSPRCGRGRRSDGRQRTFLDMSPPILHSDKDYMFDSRAGGRRLFKRDRQEHEAG